MKYLKCEPKPERISGVVPVFRRTLRKQSAVPLSAMVRPLREDLEMLSYIQHMHVEAELIWLGSVKVRYQCITGVHLDAYYRPLA
jgi:hypothetical protein